MFSTCNSYSEKVKAMVTPKHGIGGRNTGKRRSMALPMIYLVTTWGGWLTHALSQGTDPANIANYSSIQCYIIGLENLKEKST
jgi:hypothetical protein